MIAVPYAPDFMKNASKSTRASVSYCTICGKPIKCSFEFAHMVGEPEKSTFFVTEAELKEIHEKDSMVDYGIQTIGADCLEKHPELKPYIGFA